VKYETIAAVLIIAAVLSALLTWRLIPLLRKHQAGQNIREEGPKAHMSKAGTPSMGGIAIVIAAAAAVVSIMYNDSDTVMILTGFILFALIGFLDDYLKVIKKQNEGLKAWQKFGAQLIIAIALACWLAFLTDKGTDVYIPFADKYADFGIWYIPFIVFTIVAMVNAVNLTDGLDGLAAGTTGIVCAFMTIIAREALANTSTLFFAALLGACIGFMIFNRHPAKIFMGDTGSLALGAGITMAAIVMKMELLLPLVGLIYVLEALSVCLQVGYFKATGGKRLFKMAPLHHHFELSGMGETKVVVMFWIFTFLCCAVALAVA